MKLNESDKIYSEIIKSRHNNQPAVLATVIDKTGSGPVFLGKKMLVFADGKKIGTIGGGDLERVVLKDASNAMRSGQSMIKKYILTEDGSALDSEPTEMLCGGEVSVFFENIISSTKIFIFGGGHIGKALAYHLKSGDYFTTIIDNRPEIADNISDADDISIADYHNAYTDKQLPRNSYFIITTHSHELDYVVLKRLIELDCMPAYIGLVASKTKFKTIISRLKKELDYEPNLSVLYSPVGLDIGGSSPDEIAISIVSEIQTIKYGRKNNHLSKIQNGIIINS